MPKQPFLEGNGALKRKLNKDQENYIFMTWANYKSCNTLNKLQKIVREFVQKDCSKSPNKPFKWKLSIEIRISDF
jgi:hypothetical protein